MQGVRDFAVTMTGCSFVVFGFVVCCFGIDLMIGGNVAGITVMVFGALSVVFGAYLIIESNTGETYTLREQDVVELSVLEDSSCRPTSFVVVRTTV